MWGWGTKIYPSHAPLPQVFKFRFFSWISVLPVPPNIPLGPLLIFSKIRWDVHKWMFITGVNKTGNKFSACINDTGEISSPVTTTPTINLLPVTRTRMTSRWGAAKDRKKLKRTNRRYLQPSMLDTAAVGVIGTSMKSCIHKVEHRPMRPPKANNAVLVLSSFGCLRGLWSGCVRCLCAFSWQFQWQYRRLWPTSAARDSCFCRKNRPLSSIQLITGGKIYQRFCWHRWTI